MCGNIIGMYIRTTSRKNKDGSKIQYLQLAHNERHPITGQSQAKVLYNFGRADDLNKEKLRGLAQSIARLLGEESVVKDTPSAAAPLKLISTNQ